MAGYSGGLEVVRAFLVPPTLLAAARESETGQEESQLSVGLSGLLEAEEEQAGAIGTIAPIRAQHYPSGFLAHGLK